MYKVQVCIMGDGYWTESKNKGLYGMVFGNVKEALIAIEVKGSGMEYRVVDLNGEVVAGPFNPRTKSMPKYTAEVFSRNEWVKSGNYGICGKEFATTKEAIEAVEKYGSFMPYRVINSVSKEVVATLDKTPASTKKYVVELKCFGRTWEGSGNDGLRGIEFDTKEAAKAAFKEFGSPGVTYRIVEKETKLAAALKGTIAAVNSAAPVTETDVMGYDIRQVVISLAQKHQFFTADQVQKELAKRGYTSAQIGNRAGSFFRGNGITERTTETVGSRRAGRNGSKISVHRSLLFTGPKETNLDLTRFVAGYNAKGATA